MHWQFIPKPRSGLEPIWNWPATAATSKGRCFGHSARTAQPRRSGVPCTRMPLTASCESMPGKSASTVDTPPIPCAPRSSQLRSKTALNSKTYRKRPATAIPAPPNSTTAAATTRKRRRASLPHTDRDYCVGPSQGSAADQLESPSKGYQFCEDECLVSSLVVALLEYEFKMGTEQRSQMKMWRIRI